MIKRLKSLRANYYNISLKIMFGVCNKISFRKLFNFILKCIIYLPLDFKAYESYIKDNYKNQVSHWDIKKLIICMTIIVEAQA